jgi:hypothetical protein
MSVKTHRPKTTGKKDRIRHYEFSGLNFFLFKNKEWNASISG